MRGGFQQRSGGILLFHVGLVYRSIRGGALTPRASEELAGNSDGCFCRRRARKSRATYASLMLQQGESVAYVQRQLGHASIQLTVDTYGKWLPMGNKGAVVRLDEVTSEPSGSKMEQPGGQRVLSAGAGERNRTSNLRFTKTRSAQTPRA